MNEYKKGMSGWGLLALLGVLIVAYFILCKILEVVGH